MGSTQMYSLSWGEFGSSLASTVQVLRGHGDLVDVTLAAGGRIFPAHKLVLSAASPLLMELLKSTGCQHPVVMLAGVTAHDLEALLQFVYNGEVSVDHSQLTSLLQAAHCLDIQALLHNTLASEKMMCQSMTVGHDTETRNDNLLVPVRRRKRKQRRTENGVPNKWPHIESIGTENMLTTLSTVVPLTDCKEESSGCNEDNLTSSKKLVSDQPVECSICGVVLKQSRNLRRHLALIHMKTTGVRSRKTKTDKIKKEGAADAINETDNSLSSNGASLLRSVPAMTLPFANSGLLSGPLYQQSPPPPPPLTLMSMMTQVSSAQSEPQSHQTTPPPLVPVSQAQEQLQPGETQIISVPCTTSLCDNINNPTFISTTSEHTMQFAPDSLFRQHSNELMRNASLYNISDTREHCAND